jgi:hypothetical protein
MTTRNWSKLAQDAELERERTLSHHTLHHRPLRADLDKPSERTRKPSPVRRFLSMPPDSLPQ